MYTAQLGQIVEALLSEHPMVIVPGVGGLVREQLSARMDAGKQVMSPPSETLIFNPRLQHNDGLLVSTVADHWGLGIRMADDWLTDAVTELRFSLNSGSEVHWANVGTLAIGSDGHVRFSVDPQREAAPMFFGLRTVQLGEPVTLPAPKRAATVLRQVPVRKVVGYAAAAAIMGLLAWLPFQQGVISEGRHLVAEMGLMPHAHQSVFSPRAFHPIDFDFTETSLPLSDVSVENPLTAVTPKITAYHVIAESFSTASEAEDFLGRLKARGFNPVIIDDNGMKAVSYGIYSDRQQAEAMLASVKLSNPRAVVRPD